MKEFFINYALSMSLCTSAAMLWIAVFRTEAGWETLAFFALWLGVSVCGVAAHILTPRAQP